MGRASGACHTAAVSTQARSGKGARVAPTLEEVAARAGVSRATASRVLRGDKKVSEHARTVVLDAAEAISYVPNLAARSLVTGRSDSVAFLVEETEERMFSDPFFLGMLRSAQESVAEAGLQLVFTVMTRPEDQARFLAYAAGGHVDGVLLLSLHGQDKLPQRLEDLGVPTVLSGRPLSGRRRLWYVDADNVGGGALATAHLLSAGRRQVATVTGPLDMCAGQDRLAGYREGRRGRGPRVRREPGVGGRLHLRRVGTTPPAACSSSDPTSTPIFAGSDLAAFGVIRALRDVGRSARRRRGGDRLRRHPGGRRAAAAAHDGPPADRRARGGDDDSPAAPDRRARRAPAPRSCRSSWSCAPPRDEEHSPRRAVRP